MPNEEKEKKQAVKKEGKDRDKDKDKDKDKAGTKGPTTKDFDVWFPKIEFIDTIHSERIKIPVLSAGKEAKVFQYLARLLEHLPKTEAEDDTEAFSAAGLLDMLPNLLKEAPKDAFSIAAEILTSKERPIDDKWVQDNLNFDKIFEMIIPFVAGEAKLFDKVSGLLERMSTLVSF